MNGDLADALPTTTLQFVWAWDHWTAIAFATQWFGVPARLPFAWAWDIVHPKLNADSPCGNLQLIPLEIPKIMHVHWLFLNSNE